MVLRCYTLLTSPWASCWTEALPTPSSCTYSQTSGTNQGKFFWKGVPSGMSLTCPLPHGLKARILGKSFLPRFGKKLKG